MSDLFEQFQPVTAKQWKQKIQAELKGEDYNKSLFWKSEEGIDVAPFYHSDNKITAKSIAPIQPWKICQTIEVNNETNANELAKNALGKGVESIFFSLKTTAISVRKLLNGLSDVTIHLKSDCWTSELISQLDAFSNTVLHIDPIGNFAKTGNWSVTQEDDFLLLNLSNKKSISVDISIYQNAGANIVQQLAYGLGHTHEYLVQKHKKKFVFNVSVGANYFFEIAKLRALRWLFETISTQYQAETNCSIIATPTFRNKTIYDYNTNTLRSTTEYMSAILGGADTIATLPYDWVFNHPNPFSDQLSVNQLLILKNESYFGKVSNPAEGAYYIESLTEQLANKALLLFKETEILGGFLKQLKKGNIQQKIDENAAKEQALFDSNRKVLVGINKYQDEKDKMKGKLQKDPFLSSEKPPPLISPIVSKRLSERLEKNRLSKES